MEKRPANSSRAGGDDFNGFIRSVSLPAPSRDNASFSPAHGLTANGFTGSGLDPAGVRLRRCGAWTGVSAFRHHRIVRRVLHPAEADRVAHRMKGPGAARAFDLCSVTPGLRFFDTGFDNSVSQENSCSLSPGSRNSFVPAGPENCALRRKADQAFQPTHAVRSITGYFRGKGRRAARLRPLLPQDARFAFTDLHKPLPPAVMMTIDAGDPLTVAP